MSTLRRSTAFCGLGATAIGDVRSDDVAAVIGAGTALGTPHDGAENGPFFVRTVTKLYTWSASEPAVHDLRHGGTLLDRVVDLGDIDFTGLSLDQALDAIESAVGGLPPQTAPCVIGGDHTITLPVVRALAARRSEPFFVLHFDHHLDLQVWDGAPAKSDMQREPVFNTNVMSYVSDRIGPGRLVQVGLSPYATVEASSAAALPGYLRPIGTQLSVTAPEIADMAAFHRVVGSGRDVYVSVDVDVLDRTEMSATAYPAEVGLSTLELLRLIDVALENNRIIGFDLVEFAAARNDREPKTLADAQRAALVFLHLLGWVRRQARNRTSQPTVRTTAEDRSCSTP